MPSGSSLRSGPAAVGERLDWLREVHTTPSTLMQVPLLVRDPNCRGVESTPETLLAFALVPSPTPATAVSVVWDLPLSSP